MNKNIWYRSIPKVDVLLEETAIQEMIVQYNRDTVVEAIRQETETLRTFIGTCQEEDIIQEQIQQLLENIESSVVAMNTPNMQ
ncbi:MAG: L-seryl-tRNA(Sec) selenium transferase, partial [Lachnospiraceae bacterium]